MFNYKFCDRTLNVSFSGHIWNFIESDPHDINALLSIVGMTEVASRVLCNRGIKSIKEVETIIDSRLLKTIPEPFFLNDMERAVERVFQSVINDEKVFVFGDYDVDGVTSTCLLVRYLHNLGVISKYKLPNRFSDGYGLLPKWIKFASDEGCSLLISLDSGTSAFSAVEFAKEVNIDVIVLDHHIAPAVLPEAFAVVNPNRKDQEDIGGSAIKCLCSAGIVFLFIIALQRRLRDFGFFKSGEPDLRQILDIVALGTVCDVMELRGMNRAMVKYVIDHEVCSDSLRFCLDYLNISKINSPEVFAFSIGPLINAAGRLADPNIALGMLLASDKGEAMRYIEGLQSLNSERKDLEKQVLIEAIGKVKEYSLDSKKAICVSGNGWHEGVIGIIAGKLKDKFKKPVFVITFGESEEGKGSARSLDGVPISGLFEAAKACGILIKGGGHAFAGGFSILRDRLSDFDTFINEFVDKYEVKKSISIDCTLSAKSDIENILNSISCLEPFGKGLEEPMFCFMKLHLVKFFKTKDGNHMQLFLRGEAGGDLRGILFNISSKSEIVSSLEKYRDSMIDIIAKLKKSTSFGYSLIIEDIRLTKNF